MHRAVCYGKEKGSHRRAAEEPATHPEIRVKRLAAHEASINCGEEGCYRVVLGHEERVDGAVRARDVPVDADPQTEHDVAHGKSLQPNRRRNGTHGAQDMERAGARAVVQNR